MFFNYIKNVVLFITVIIINLVFLPCHGIEIIGHRGCLYEPENTVAAFRRAIELRVDTIKFDVWVCKTGELIVINDERVDRLTTTKGMVKNFTLQELKKMKVLGKETFLTLQEALDYIDKKVNVFIEFKEKGIVESVASIMNDYILHHGWKKDLFMVASFFHNDLMQFMTLCPGVKTVASYVGEPLHYAQFAQDMSAYGIGTVSKYLTKEFVDDAHRRNIKMYVYAVDCELETLKKCITLGADGIMADYPDKLTAALIM
jgi:glycerophosphoryl diester phosphodiesterase